MERGFCLSQRLAKEGVGEKEKVQARVSRRRGGYHDSGSGQGGETRNLAFDDVGTAKKRIVDLSERVYQAIMSLDYRQMTTTTLKLQPWASQDLCPAFMLNNDVISVEQVLMQFCYITPEP